MTDPMMPLGALVEKAPDADILREMMSFAAGRLMEMKVGDLTGAVADQSRPKLPKLATLMDKAEPDVLAYMTLETMAPVSDNPITMLPAARGA